MTRVVSLLALALVTAPPVAAHVDPGVTGSLGSGLVHPLLGTDHLLAMVAVGLLAGMRDQFARFVLPAAFVAAMAFGLGLGASGLALPYTEAMILSSIMILGGLLASGLSTSIVLGASLAGIFGLFHGAAHGLEMGGAHLAPYAAGVLGATTFLHGLGMVLAALLMRWLGQALARVPLQMLGAGLGLGGVTMLLAG